MIFQIFGTLSVCLCTTVFSCFVFVINLFTAAQFNILSMQLQSLCEFTENNIDKRNVQLQIESYKRLRYYIQKHQILINYTNEVDNLYCFAMLGQILGSVTQICFSGFQILLVSSKM